MKSIKFFLTTAFIALATFVNAQPLPGQNGNGNPSNVHTIASAPIGDGLLILGILAALYAGKKIYGLYLENKEAAEQEN